jgi:SAM-dependent methyltransferase
MFERSIEWYDRLYAWKDYRAEAEAVRAVLARHQRSPGRRLLDAACGTGLHLEHLRESHVVEGIDLSPEMVARARERLPGVPVHVGDLRSFRLPGSYDAIVCLFSSIGYLPAVEDLREAMRTFAAHLAPGGAVLVEPWFAADRLRHGHVAMLTVDDPELKICRMNSAAFDGRTTTLDFHFLVGTPAGTEHFVERHRLTSFRAEEIAEALRAAGLEPSYTEEAPWTRGLHIGAKPLA